MNVEKQEIILRIKELKKEKNAVILVHNYQDAEIYEVADFIGDSLELSRKATQVNADIIVFCGVRFMAETAKLLNPGKLVLLPHPEATCSMADMSSVEGLEILKKNYPHAAVVCYINTNADVKALSDIICTSANAVEVVESLPNDEIIFLPDKNLASYVQSKTKKKIIPYDGWCYVHNTLNAGILQDIKEKFPKAEVIAHPESPKDVLAISEHICGTGGMANAARKSQAREFIMVTECGMAEKLRKDVPEKVFYSFCNICSYMKMTNLFLVEKSLVKLQYPIEVPLEIASDAKRAIERMLNI